MFLLLHTIGFQKRFSKHLLVKMVRKIAAGKKEYFECGECNFLYNEVILAEKCEKWCREHHSCNIEITKHAVKLG